MDELKKRDPRSNEGRDGRARWLSEPLSHGNSKAKREVGGQEAVANAAEKLSNWLQVPE